MTIQEYDPNIFRLIPPTPGACPLCAYKHSPNEPHFPGSTYYIMRFFQRHGRRPTWKDAMAHCPKETKEQWTNDLIECGVLPKEDAMEDG